MSARDIEIVRLAEHIMQDGSYGHADVLIVAGSLIVAEASIRVLEDQVEDRKDEQERRIASLEAALRALHDAVDRFVIATDDVDVRGAMVLSRKLLSTATAEEVGGGGGSFCNDNINNKET